MVGEKFDFLNLRRLRDMSSPCNWWQHDKLILCFLLLYNQLLFQ